MGLKKITTASLAPSAGVYKRSELPFTPIQPSYANNICDTQILLYESRAYPGHMREFVFKDQFVDRSNSTTKYYKCVACRSTMEQLMKTVTKERLSDLVVPFVTVKDGHLLDDPDFPNSFDHFCTPISIEKSNQNIEKLFGQNNVRCDDDKKQTNFNNLSMSLQSHHNNVFQPLKMFCVMCGMDVVNNQYGCDTLSSHRRKFSNMSGQHGCPAYHNFYDSEGFAKLIRKVEANRAQKISTKEERQIRFAQAIARSYESAKNGTVYILMQKRKSIDLKNVEYIGQTSHSHKRKLQHELALKLYKGSVTEAESRRFLIICKNISVDMAKMIEFGLIHLFPIHKLRNTTLPYPTFDYGKNTIRGASVKEWLHFCVELLFDAFDAEKEQIQSGQAMEPDNVLRSSHVEITTPVTSMACHQKLNIQPTIIQQSVHSSTKSPIQTNVITSSSPMMQLNYPSNSTPNEIAIMEDIHEKELFKAKHPNIENFYYFSQPKNFKF